jgi:hypothetical protein
VIRAREGLVDAPPARGGAARARGDARIALALFSVSLLWCSSLSASEALVDLFLPPAGRPTDAAVVADAASLLAAHAARAERDLAACAERQTRACVRNVRLDAEKEARRANEKDARNEAVAELAAAVSEACVALDARVEDALRVVAARRAPEDLLWRRTSETNATNADVETEATREPCSARHRAAIRGRAAVSASAERRTNASNSSSSSSMADTLANVSVTYRVAAETYRAETEAVIERAAEAVTDRAAYDRDYAANATSALASARLALEHNVTTELVALVRAASEGLGALDTDAGARLRALASEAGSALADTRDQVEAAARTYVATTRAYVSEVSAQLAEAKAWFDTFAGIGSVVKSMLGDLATSLPSVDAPAPPALRLADLSPQIVPNISSAVNAAVDAADAAADAVAAVADAARLRLANAAARVPAAFEAPALAVFEDYDPPPRETNDPGESAGDDPGGVRGASAFAASARGDADARWSRFSVAVAVAADAVDAEREALNASRANATGELETLEREVADLEEEVASNVSKADLAGAVASFAAASAERLDAAAANASSAASAAAEWLGVAGPDVGAWRAAVAAAAAAADGLAGADLAYRFARSFQHVARHFEGSKRGRLPPVDLTVDAAAAAAAASRGTARKTALMSAAAAIGHPACQAVVRVSAVALVTALVAEAYLPFHDAYRRGCVSGRGGTFATKNAHALAHNYAAASASRVVETGNAEVERERVSSCAASAPPSAARLANAKARVSAAAADARRAGEALRRVERCVDADALLSDATLAEGDVWNATGHLDDTRNGNASFPDSSPDSAWVKAVRTLLEMDALELDRCFFSASDEAFVLDDGALFDCAALGACASARCGGPRREVLEPLAFAAGCLAEGTAHASLLRAALILAVFLAANAMRETAVEGAAALCWRALAGDDGVSFRGTLALDGATLVEGGGGFRESGAAAVSNDPKRAARAKLAQTARAHEMRGAAKVAAAAAAQVPGLVALYFARRASLAPDFACVELKSSS